MLDDRRLRFACIVAALDAPQELAQAWLTGNIDADLDTWPPDLLDLLPLVYDPLIANGVVAGELATWAGIARHAWVSNAALLAAMDELAAAAVDAVVAGDIPLRAIVDGRTRVRRPQIVIAPLALDRVLGVARARGWRVSAPARGRAGAWIIVEGAGRIEVIPKDPIVVGKGRQEASIEESFVEMLASIDARSEQIPAWAIVTSARIAGSGKLNTSLAASALNRRRCVGRALVLADALDECKLDEGTQIRGIAAESKVSWFERAAIRVPRLFEVTCVIADSHERGQMRRFPAFLAHRWCLARRRDIPQTLVRKVLRSHV